MSQAAQTLKEGARTKSNEDEVRAQQKPPPRKQGAGYSPALQEGNNDLYHSEVKKPTGALTTVGIPNIVQIFKLNQSQEGSINTNIICYWLER